METTKRLIPDRVMLIGEGEIPQEAVEALSDELVQIFMREPDPADWPAELEHLVIYLPEQERQRYVIARVLRRHDGLLKPALENWILAAWRDLVEGEGLGSPQRDAVVHGMTEHLKGLIAGCLEDRED